MASVAMTLSAIALFIGASSRHRHESRYLTAFVGIMWVGFGLCFVGVGFTQNGADLLGNLVQWTLLVPTGALAIWGVRREFKAVR